MSVLLFGREELLVPWVVSSVEHVLGFDAPYAIGIATGETEQDRLMGAVIFHSWDPDARVCQMTFAASDPRWALPHIMGSVLANIFCIEGSPFNRIYTIVPHKQERTVRLLKLLGFVREGVLREHLGPGIHGVVCSMLRKEFFKRYPTFAELEKRYGS